MKITNFSFHITHGADSGCALTLQHGGDRLEMVLTAQERRALGVALLDPSTGEPGAGDGAPEVQGHAV